jgi:iron complex outermembrane receptor protein
MAWPKLCAWAAGLLPALALWPVQAQQTVQDPPTLEELLRQAPSEVTRDIEESTSSRFARSAAQAPSVTYVVTDVEIARQGLRNMADILRAMPGLYVADDGEFSYIGARGLGRPGDFNARLLFLIDGMRVNENICDAGLLGPEFFVDVDLIDRVEYAPAPAPPCTAIMPSSAWSTSSPRVSTSCTACSCGSIPIASVAMKRAPV